MTKLCFVDTETTSLDDRTGEIWEVAIIVREDWATNNDKAPADEQYVWQLPVDLTLADPMSLKINNFHERRWPTVSDMAHDIDWVPIADRAVAGLPYPDPETVMCVVPDHRMDLWAAEFVKLTRGAHLIGNVTSFDEERLRKLLREKGQCPMWHYHIVCIENLIAGRLGIQPPWKSKDLSEAIGIPVPEDQHGALPDTKWARDMYDAVFDPSILRVPFDPSKTPS